MCALLFGEAIRQVIVDSYLKFLCSPSSTDMGGHVTTYIPSGVQIEILSVDAKKSLSEWTDDDMNNFLIKPSSYSMKTYFDQLDKMNVQETRYILIPIVSGWHWFMVVLNTKKKCFHLMNSLKDSSYTFIAKVACFYNKYFLAKKQLNFSATVDEHEIPSHQYDDLVSCSIYLCRFALCFAKDKESIWADMKTCNMDIFRAKIACELLSNGLVN